MAELVLLQLINMENEMTTSSEDDSDANNDVWCKLQKEMRSNVDILDISESR
jgi:hypothetical protein